METLQNLITPLEASFDVDIISFNNSFYDKSHDEVLGSWIE